MQWWAPAGRREILAEGVAVTLAGEKGGMK